MTTFNIPDMSCGHCKAAVENAVKGVDSAAKVTVDLEKKQAQVDSSASTAALIAALAEEGYPATVA